MLLYCQQFCKAFLAQVPPAWQTAWAVWPSLSPRRLAHRQRSLHRASHTPRRLAAPMGLVTPITAPTPRAAARPWGYPRARRLCGGHSLHPTPVAIRPCQGCPVSRCPRGLRRHHAGVHVRRQWRGAYLRETPRVPTGDAPTYLRETLPRTYGRRSHVPTGDAPTYLRETNFTISLYDTISYAF